MQIGMIGLGRMGGNMVRRLLRAGHECIVYDIHPDSVAALEAEGAKGADSLESFVELLQPPRTAWIMLPAAIVGKTVDSLAALMAPDDIIIDGGNSPYREAVDADERLKASGIHFVDVGTSGGVWGLDRGYCLMIGGDRQAVQRLDPVFAALAPGGEGETPAERGYLHCGPAGAGHFVKMVHNGIEYGMMAAYAEGMNLLKAANAGARDRDADAETTPLDHPEYYRFDLDVASIAEVWRHGSVISSWLLDLTAQALSQDPNLDGYDGRVSDSGEGRWTINAAIDTGVPVPVLSAALFQRFTSRGESEFADRLLSSMRFAFGGHLEKK
ncbi:phosphogluconate dehydrogenase (NAD(+)-dependent, decarboxylating) [Oricola nitratireducens]|uniref:phosphogluconate dehydrogenase (NAD(+)-dependent, decarboxylating) n=1 Tax=Oricola nitratireducens TaxID=2775868 RepID=UPI001868D2A7|nr:decarboxylating 6-phosphogluconate dehydrogenase [Oricola nitratireducens]